MSRSTPSLARIQTAAYDFDVVTDVTVKPARRPPAADTARSEAATAEKPKAEAAEPR